MIKTWSRVLEEKTGSKRQVNENSDGEDQEKQYQYIYMAKNTTEATRDHIETIHSHMHGGRRRRASVSHKTFMTNWKKHNRIPKNNDRPVSKKAEK